MAFQKFNVSDDAFGRLNADITAVETSIVLSSSQNLPATNWIGTLVHFDTYGVIISKEKVLVSSFSAGTATVTR